MSRTGRVRQFFGDAKYDFQLNIEQLEELEEETGVGYGQIWAELQPTPLAPFGLFSVKRVRLVLRLGLIGGGMDKERAARMVARHAVPPDLGDCSALANVVLGAVCVGVPEEPLGESPGEEATPDPLSPTGEPDGATSTKPVARSAGTRKRSAGRRSGSCSKPSKATARPTA